MICFFCVGALESVERATKNCSYNEYFKQVDRDGLGPTDAIIRELTICYCYCYFLTPVLNSQGMKKITLCNTKKYKNQAGMNLTPPPPSQNSNAVRWHCTAESERRIVWNCLPTALEVLSVTAAAFARTWTP